MPRTLLQLHAYKDDRIVYECVVHNACTVLYSTLQYKMYSSPQEDVWLFAVLRHGIEKNGLMCDLTSLALAGLPKTDFFWLQPKGFGDAIWSCAIDGNLGEFRSRLKSVIFVVSFNVRR